MLRQLIQQSTYAIVCVFVGLLTGGFMGAVYAATAGSAAASAESMDLIKALGFGGALVGVYIAMDRRLTTLETSTAGDNARIEQKIDLLVGGLTTQIEGIKEDVRGAPKGKP